MVYGVEMTLPLDLMLGDTLPEQPEHECHYEYVGWIKDSLHLSWRSLEVHCDTRYSFRLGGGYMWRSTGFGLGTIVIFNLCE